jgi:hypothetical protein
MGQADLPNVREFQPLRVPRGKATVAGQAGLAAGWRRRRRHTPTW